MTMTSEAATAIATLLAVLWLAFTLEGGRLTRSEPDAHRPGAVVTLSVFATAFFAEEALLVVVINGGGSAGAMAVIGWIGAAVIAAALLFMFVGIVGLR